jgi:glycosyltransferase involved in cell wall biosynthesis
MLQIGPQRDGRQLANTTKPHICFVAPNIYPVLSGDFSHQIVGGAELQQAIIARGLVERGYRVSVICRDFGQEACETIDGIEVHKTFRQDAGLPIIRFLYPRLVSIWSRLREVDADIYYTRTASLLAGVVAKFSRRYNRKSIFAGADNRDFLLGESRIRFRRDRLIYEWGIRNTDKLIAQNRQQIDSCYLNYQRVPIEIPNCLVPPLADINQQRSKILWVSTIRELKRPGRLIALAKLLPHREFVIVGGPDKFEAPLFERIKQQARAEPNIEFAGFVPLSAVDSYFYEARILVNTSDSEGFPNTFLQAWAYGVPTISFIDFGLRATDGEIGYSVDTVQQMADNSEKLFLDEREYLRMGEICRHYCYTHHSPEVVFSKYERLFDELMLGNSNI